MANENNGFVAFNPQEALAEIDGAADTMAETTEAPRSLMFVLLTIVSTALALVNIVPWAVIFGIACLLIPVGLWHFLLMRKRPKKWAVLNHSGPYIVNALLLLLVTQCSRFWEPGAWWEIVAKWLVIFTLSWIAVSRMRATTIKNRIKDANEHSF